MTVTATQADPTSPPVEVAVTGLAAPPDSLRSAINIDGTSGAYVSVPDAAVLDIVGDIQLRVDCALADWTPSAAQYLLSKWDTASNQSYGLYVLSTGIIRMRWSSNGSNTVSADSTVAPTVADGDRLAVRADLDVNNGAAGNTTVFYTAPTIEGPWTQLGSPVVNASTTSIFSGTAVLSIGGHTNGTTDRPVGLFYGAEVRSGLPGAATTVAAARMRDVAVGATSFTDFPGRTWTLNGTAAVIAEDDVLDSTRLTGTIQRSTDGVIYRFARGGVDMPISSAGALADLLDYEFRPGVVNTYRAGLMQQIAALFGTTAASSWPAADTGQAWDAANAAFNTAAGSGVGAILHSAANSEFETRLSTPDDLADFDLTVDVTNNAASGITGADAGAHVVLRHLDTTHRYLVRMAISSAGVVTLSLRSGYVDEVEVASSATGLTFDGSQRYRIRVRVDGHRVRAVVWLPSATPQPDYLIDETIVAGRRITGGKVGLSSYRATSNTNTSLTWRFDNFIVETDEVTTLQTGTITPDLSGFWLCSTMRSFLNIAPRVVGYDEPKRIARGGSQYVAGRTLPIAQNEVSGARTWMLTLHTSNVSAARRIEYAIASGDVWYLQTPADCPIPFGYYRFGDMGSARVIRNGSARLFTLPLDEAAAPGPDVAPSPATWDTVIALYGTWPDVVSAQPTWEDLRELVGDPSEVIVE